MSSSTSRVKDAINALKQGKMVILTDHPDRENEGDLIAPAETITNEQMNFMIRQGTGIVCMSITEDLAQKMQLPLMVSKTDNSSFRGTPFTVSIDATNGITTGVSAADRVSTIKATIADNAVASDLVKPGHIFPLLADSHGVLGRDGHTEGSIDLVKMAGFKSAAVLCEIMHEDGDMLRGEQLLTFAEQQDLPILSIDDLITERLRCENLIADQVSTSIHLNHYGTFNCTVIKEAVSGKEHIVLSKPSSQESPLVRLHSACSTGDIFGSTRCDCQEQLHYSLEQLSNEGGYLVYLSQEGRGIGLLNKLKAYHLQDKGLDTVEANLELNLPVDDRKYYIAANYLKSQDVTSIRLLTNNPNKIANLEIYGFDNIERIEMPVFCSQYNFKYLKTKKDKLNHFINLSDLVKAEGQS